MYTTVGFLNSSLEVSEFSEGGNLVVMASGFSPVGDIQVFLQYINGTARGTYPLILISVNIAAVSYTQCL